MKIILSFILIVFSSLTISYANEGHLTLNIDGMTCPACAASIESQLLKIEEVKTLNINLRQNQVKVALEDNTKLEEQVFKEAVQKAGFKLISTSKE